MLLCFSSCAQEAASTRTEIKTDELEMGETTISISITSKSPSRSFVFVRLHDNEKTSEESVLNIMDQEGGTLISIENDNSRNIVFELNGRRHRFDPNRIFSEAGRRQTLEEHNDYTVAAAKELELFAEFILEKTGNQTILAVHNNTENDFTINDYISGDRQGDAILHYRNPDMDEDDFVFTTDRKIYDELKKQNISVVLQNNQSAKEDGSLSVYCGKRQIRYANIEAQHGHGEEQERMVRAVLKILDM